MTERTKVNGVPVDSVDRQKVDKQTKQSIAENIDGGKLETALNQILEVVSGKTKEEILKEAQK